MKRPNIKHIIRRKTLTLTIAENKCEYLVISNFKSELDIKKDAILLSARVHPGESSSSHVMEGLLKILTGDSEKAKIMRDKYLFKVVPMLNPDGVITGNYRTNLAGYDLNRNWATPDKKVHPTISCAKKMIEDLGKSK
jgi:murein tripeptide amidase MpaA